MCLLRFISVLSAFLALALPFREGLAGSLEGKTITYIISTKPGGGYDAYGRLVAKYMQLHIPGSTFVAKNVPGAGHRIAAETLYASPPDGTVIGTINTSLLYGQIAGMFGDKLDLSRMSWIGKAATDTRVFVISSKSQYKTVDDLRTAKQPVRIAVNGKGSSGHLESSLIASLLGVKFEQLFGYEGSDGPLAMMRGEVEIIIGSRSSLQAVVDRGDGRFLLSFGGPAFGDTPDLETLVEAGHDTTLLSLIDGQGRYGRVTLGPPGLPADILQELRSAYDAAVRDPGFLKEAEAQKLPIDPGNGVDVDRYIKSALQQSPEIQASIKALLADE